MADDKEQGRQDRGGRRGRGRGKDEDPRERASESERTSDTRDQRVSVTCGAVGCGNEATGTREIDLGGGRVETRDVCDDHGGQLDRGDQVVFVSGAATKTQG